MRKQNKGVSKKVKLKFADSFFPLHVNVFFFSSVLFSLINNYENDFFIIIKKSEVVSVFDLCLTLFESQQSSTGV